MLFERKLTETELSERDSVMKGLLKDKSQLVKKYGADAEKVMYGIATKQGKKRVEKMNLENLRELIKQSLYKEDNDPSGEYLEGDPNEKVEENLIKEFISGPLGKRNDALFDKLVPGSGDSETVEGEMIRAINRIIYRFFNDGDYFYRGYGAETAGPAHSFLVNSNQIPFDIQSTLTSTFNKAMDADEDGYERLIKFALEKVVDHVEATPEDEYTKLDRGMFDFESEFEDEDEDYDDYYDEEEEDYYMNEEKEDIDKILKAQKIIKKVLKDEGGAAGLKPIVDALKDLKIKKDELIKILKKTVGVVKHQHGDYIIKPIEEIKEGVEKRMFTYLSDLRDSGVTNMFGAAPYLANEFGLDKRSAREILAKWMKSFGESIDLKINSLVKEKLTKRHKVGDFVDDFKKSDAKQFKGKSAKKKKEMAVAAYLAKQNEK